MRIPKAFVPLADSMLFAALVLLCGEGLEDVAEGGAGAPMSFPATVKKSERGKVGERNLLDSCTQADGGSSTKYSMKLTLISTTWYHACVATNTSLVPSIELTLLSPVPP